MTNELEGSKIPKEILEIGKEYEFAPGFRETSQAYIGRMVKTIDSLKSEINARAQLINTLSTTLSKMNFIERYLTIEGRFKASKLTQQSELQRELQAKSEPKLHELSLASNKIMAYLANSGKQLNIAKQLNESPKSQPVPTQQTTDEKPLKGDRIKSASSALRKGTSKSSETLASPGVQQPAPPHKSKSKTKGSKTHASPAHVQAASKHVTRATASGQAVFKPPVPAIPRNNSVIAVKGTSTKSVDLPATPKVKAPPPPRAVQQPEATSKVRVDPTQPRRKQTLRLSEADKKALDDEAKDIYVKYPNDTKDQQAAKLAQAARFYTSSGGPQKTIYLYLKIATHIDARINVPKELQKLSQQYVIKDDNNQVIWPPAEA